MAERVSHVTEKLEVFDTHNGPLGPTTQYRSQSSGNDWNQIENKN